MTCNIRLSHVSVAMMNVLLRKKALKMSVCALVSSGVCILSADSARFT